MLEKTSQDMPGSGSLQSCKVIFGIAFGQTIKSKRTVFALIVAFLPVLLAVLYRIWERDLRPYQPPSHVMAAEQVLSLFMLLFLQFLSVLIALFYATAIVADEIDNRTITYLFTRPIRKYSIILGKFAAYLLEVFLLLIPPMLLTFLIIAIGGGTSTSFVDKLSIFSKQLGVTVLALVVYGAVFTFFGTWWKRPLLLGLIFAFGWEKTVLVVPGTVRKFSVIHYLMSLFPKAPVHKGFMNLPQAANSSPAVSIIVLLIITCIFFGLAIFTLYRKEYRFE